MIILERTYKEIIGRLSPLEYEAGGILGGKDGVIGRFVLDEGQEHYSDKYVPNVLFMNQKIAEWLESGIEFCGLVHNHLTKAPKLSHEDAVYIRQIMRSLPPSLEQLYFPLVIPRRQIIPFMARRNEDKVLLVNDILQII